MNARGLDLTAGLLLCLAACSPKKAPAPARLQSVDSAAIGQVLSNTEDLRIEELGNGTVLRFKEDVGVIPANSIYGYVFNGEISTSAPTGAGTSYCFFRRSDRSGLPIQIGKRLELTIHTDAPSYDAKFAQEDNGIDFLNCATISPSGDGFSDAPKLSEIRKIFAGKLMVLFPEGIKFTHPVRALRQDPSLLSRQLSDLVNSSDKHVSLTFLSDSDILAAWIASFQMVGGQMGKIELQSYQPQLLDVQPDGTMGCVVNLVQNGSLSKIVAGTTVVFLKPESFEDRLLKVEQAPTESLSAALVESLRCETFAGASARPATVGEIISYFGNNIVINLDPAN